MAKRRGRILRTVRRRVKRKARRATGVRYVPRGDVKG